MAIARRTDHESVDSMSMTRSACTRRFLATIGAVIQGESPNYTFS